MSYRTSRAYGYGYGGRTELTGVLRRVITGVNTSGEWVWFVRTRQNPTLPTLRTTQAT